MPPKKQAAGPSKKEVEKKKQKIIEDRTFGLKNKKSNKMQKYIAQVEANIKNTGPQKRTEKKKDDKDDLKDLNVLFKPVQTMPKIAADVDPKTVLCVFFKQGLCQKGKKCKYSHDLAVQQKTAKRNLYFDSRDAKSDNKEETNENWDEKMLAEVAEKKHGEADRKQVNRTEKVCNYFLDAVEDNKYGWFWECPNGKTCIYRHALPAGYVLKKERKRLEDLKKLETISLEELIEKERSLLNTATCTKVTLETFIAWKKKKLIEKKKKAAEAEKEKKAKAKVNKNGLSGRDLFTFNPDMVGDDDDEVQAEKLEREPDEDGQDDIKAFDIDDNMFYVCGEIEDIDAETTEETVPETAPAEPQVFDEDLFDADAIPDDDDDEDEDEPGRDAGGQEHEQKNRPSASEPPTSAVEKLKL